MEALIIGIGDAFSRRSFGSSAVIRTDSGYVSIDCPGDFHRALHAATRAAQWDIDASNIDDIILTHLHGDHCNGLESLGFLRRKLRFLSQNDVTPRLHTIPEVAARLWERLAPAMDAPFGEDRPSTLADYFDVRLLPNEGPADIAGLRVEHRRTQHSIPTIGLRLADERGMLGWSGDTFFSEDHITWLAPADVIVHESNVGPVHTAIDSLNALPETTRERMRLIHLPDDFDVQTTAIKLLREGEVLRPARRDTT